ncbi:hypothetical protein KS4_07520 [Poriferisphaera corsica]|uniref:PEP-CTERM sorting domain-containing protein n=1 Tax=Poriferisphaera corsica TaxID=2528020 RepID=A0A517YR65_9BACT|nr:hypothetical protein [Poriferisphaera corsica]QDU32718.1 hypothetical protein KS4_07520 [Poriferisphaera corsica]
MGRTTKIIKTSVLASALIAGPAMAASYTYSKGDWAPPGSENPPFSVSNTWNVDNSVTSAGTIEVWFFGDLDNIDENVQIQFESFDLGTLLDGNIGNDVFNAGAAGDPFYDGSVSNLQYGTFNNLGANVTDTGTQQVQIHYGKVSVSKDVIDALVADGMVSFSLNFTGDVENLMPPAPVDDWLQVKLTYVPTPAAASMGLAALAALAFRRKRDK